MGQCVSQKYGNAIPIISDSGITPRQNSFRNFLPAAFALPKFITIVMRWRFAVSTWLAAGNAL